MTDATFRGSRIAARAARSDAKPVSLPAPKPFGAPVLISETVLSLLMTRDDQ